MTGASEQWLFGPFRLIPSQRLLLEDGTPVALGARAYALLVLLAARAGEVLSNDELIAEVWRGLNVEESNVRVHVANLRRALRDGEAGARYIVNLPGRGYSFVAPITLVAPEVAEARQNAGDAQTTVLPRLVTKVIGRSELIETLCLLVAERRFVTLAGPGGIGKTTVAIAVAHQLAPGYPDGSCFVDFSATRDPDLVPSIIAASFGLDAPFRDAMPAVVAHLGRKSMLLVLDNCEHVIETVASAAEKICGSAPDVHLLATSREPLRAEGEQVHRLSPLESPPRSVALTAQEAMSFASVQLFVERFTAAVDGADISDADASLIAEICRRLDGIALAIELAAGRVAAFGLAELAARLDDRFRLLTAGLRTALPRHRTLAAMLDWSYDLLPEPEQIMVRRVAIFPGDFSLEDAAAVATGVNAHATVGHVADLVAKSLITADAGAGEARFRLLETTRLYCAGKLREHGEYAETARVHAGHTLAVLQFSETETGILSSRTWRAKFAGLLANARAALDWADGPAGDEALYVQLTIAAVPLWEQLSMMEECRRRVDRALPMVTGHERPAMVARMRLTAALGWSLMYTAGRSEEIGAAWTATLDLAEALDDANHRLRGIWGVWIGKLNRGELNDALGLAPRMADLMKDSSNETDLIIADRLMATTLHLRGEQDEARLFSDRIFARLAAARSPPNIPRFNVDQKVPAQYFRARILWLQGHVEQSQEMVRQTVRDGEALGHALLFANVLGQAACPIALLTGDLEAARRFGTMLLDHSDHHSLHIWSGWARCFAGLLTIRESDVEGGLDAMRGAFDMAGDSRFLPRYMLLLGEYAACLGSAGQFSEALQTIGTMLAGCERTGARWYEPELRRIRATVRALSDASGQPAAIEAEFLVAIDLAGRQGARSWQLRAAADLARFRLAAGRFASAREPLATIYESFAEGLATVDIQQAAQLLSIL